MKRVDVLKREILLENLELIYRLYYEPKVFEGEVINLYGVEIIAKCEENNDCYQRTVEDITSSGEIANYVFSVLCEGTVTPIGLEDCVYEILDNLYTLDR